MCYQLVEVYSSCQCLYYKHAVDRCGNFGRHPVTERTIVVGYACSVHSPRSRHGQRSTYSQPQYSDSGYHSSRSHKSSGSSHYR